jgi:signal transduction histidine kinase
VSFFIWCASVLTRCASNPFAEEGGVDSAFTHTSGTGGFWLESKLLWLSRLVQVPALDAGGKPLRCLLSSFSERAEIVGQPELNLTDQSHGRYGTFGEQLPKVGLTDVLSIKEGQMRSADTNFSISQDDELVLTIVHDIRRHLRKATIASESLEREARAILEPKLSSHLDEILAAGKDIDHLLSRLAKFAVSGSKGYEKATGDIGVMFDNALRRVAGMSTDVEIDRAYLQTCGIRVPYSVETVLAELIDNSLKFRKGPVKISVSVETELDQAVVGIVDTGIGFDLLYADKVFAPFERLHPADVYPGTGLGLAICKRIVTAWGGKIWAKSTIGSGSTFQFSLPH